MSDPGTLIPADAAGPHVAYDESFFSPSPLSRYVDSSRAASSSSWVGSSFGDHSDFGTLERRSRFGNPPSSGRESDEKEELTAHTKQPGPAEAEGESKILSNDSKKPSNVEKELGREFPGKAIYPYAHARSPSWTEGVSSPAVRKKKVKDVSKYMIDAAKENPRLAQKLHDVLLESGVHAPPDLFSEVYPEQLDVKPADASSRKEGAGENKEGSGSQETKGQVNVAPSCFLPPLPNHRVHAKASPSGQPEPLKVVEGLAGHIISTQAEIAPAKYAKNVPVAAAAAAAAAVVASSMVVAAAKSSTDPNLELPVAAAATATAAAVVATTAAVTKQYEQGMRSDGDTDSGGYEPREHEAVGTNSEGERISDNSVGNESTKSDSIEDVAECEIPWEDITMGERIGLGIDLCITLIYLVIHFIDKPNPQTFNFIPWFVLSDAGSYGEVYRGEWHGTVSFLIPRRNVLIFLCIARKLCMSIIIFSGICYI